MHTKTPVKCDFTHIKKTIMKKIDKTSYGEDWRNWHSHILLVEILNGAAPLEKINLQ